MATQVLDLVIEALRPLASRLPVGDFVLGLLTHVRTGVALVAAVFFATSLYMGWKRRAPPKSWILWIAACIWFTQILVVPVWREYREIHDQAGSMTRDIRRCVEAGFETNPFNKLCDLYRIGRSLHPLLLAYRTVTYQMESDLAQWFATYRYIVAVLAMFVAWRVMSSLVTCGEQTAIHAAHAQYHRLVEKLNALSGAPQSTLRD